MIYGTNKFVCEQLVQAYSKHYGLNSAILRLFVHGPGLRKQILWDSCKKARSGVTDFFGTGTETRDFIHVADTVSLILAAQQAASATCPIINGGSGTPTKIKDLVALIFKYFDDRLSPQFTKQAHLATRTIFWRISLSASNCNWSPAIDLESGVRDYVNWFRSLPEYQEPES